MTDGSGRDTELAGGPGEAPVARGSPGAGSKAEGGAKASCDFLHSTRTTSGFRLDVVRASGAWVNERRYEDGFGCHTEAIAHASADRARSQSPSQIHRCCRIRLHSG